MLHRAWVKANPVPWLSSHHILALQKIQGPPRLEMCGESSWHEQRKENVQGLFLPIQTQLHLWGLMPAKYFDSFICYFISPSQPLQEARECFTGYEWKKKKKDLNEVKHLIPGQGCYYTVKPKTLTLTSRSFFSISCTEKPIKPSASTFTFLLD